MISLQSIKIQNTKLLLLLILFSCSLFSLTEARAQILNVEDPTLPLDSIKKHDLKWALGISGNISKQKDLIYDATVLNEAVYHYNDKHQWLLNGQYITTGTQNFSLINSGFAYLRYTPYFHKRTTANVFVQYQTDLNRGLIERQLEGFNIRINAIQKSNIQMQCATGIFLEHERWNVSGDQFKSSGSNSYDKVKLNQNIRLFWQISQKAEITWNQFFQFPLKFEGAMPMRWSNQLSLSLPLSKHIGFQYNISSMYDTQPVIDIPEFYFNSALGISVNW
ncbi:MAG: hypothetical protein RLZZ205_18 [Bacteroidota bacterium]